MIWVFALKVICILRSIGNLNHSQSSLSYSRVIPMHPWSNCHPCCCYRFLPEVAEVAWWIFSGRLNVRLEPMSRAPIRAPAPSFNHFEAIIATLSPFGPILSPEWVAAPHDESFSDLHSCTCHIAHVNFFLLVVPCVSCHTLWL